MHELPSCLFCIKSAHSKARWQICFANNMGQKGRKWLDGERAAGYLNNHRHSGAKFPSFLGTGRYSGAGAKKLGFETVFFFAVCTEHGIFWPFLRVACRLIRSLISRFYRAADKMSKVNFFHPKTISKESKQSSSVLLGLIMLISHTFYVIKRTSLQPLN